MKRGKKNNMDVMTIFYKKRDLEIDSLCEGRQDYSFYADLHPDDAEMIYGILYVPNDRFVIKNRKGFYLEKNKQGEIELKVKEDFKRTLEKYL